jgi:hypothetical protein
MRFSPKILQHEQKCWWPNAFAAICVNVEYVHRMHMAMTDIISYNVPNTYNARMSQTKLSWTKNSKSLLSQSASSNEQHSN